MISNEQINGQIAQLGLIRIDFECFLTRNDREMTSDEVEVLSKTIDFIDQRIVWFRQNLQ